jgi:hypothetical protein
MVDLDGEVKGQQRLDEGRATTRRCGLLTSECLDRAGQPWLRSLPGWRGAVTVGAAHCRDKRREEKINVQRGVSRAVRSRIESIGATKGRGYKIKRSRGRERAATNLKMHQFMRMENPSPRCQRRSLDFPLAQTHNPTAVRVALSS